MRLWPEGLLGSNRSPEILGPAPHPPFPNLRFAISQPDPVNIGGLRRTPPDPFLCFKKEPRSWGEGQSSEKYFKIACCAILGKSLNISESFPCSKSR